MRSIICLFSLLAIFANSVIGQDQQCFPKPKSPQPSGIYCNSPRAVIDSPRASNAIIFSNLGYDVDYCAGFCITDKTCKSFTIDSVKGNCTTYKARGTTMGLGPRQPTGTVRFSNINCFAQNTTIGPVFFNYIDKNGTSQVVIYPPSSNDGRATFTDSPPPSAFAGFEFGKNCDGEIQQYQARTPNTGDVAYATNDHKVIFVPLSSSANAYKSIYIAITGNSSTGFKLSAQSVAGNSFWNCKNYLYLSDSVPVAGAGCVKISLNVNYLA